MKNTLTKVTAALIIASSLSMSAMLVADSGNKKVKFYVRNCNSNDYKNIRVCAYDKDDTARWAPYSEKNIKWGERAKLKCKSSNNECQVYATTGDSCALAKGGTMDTSDDLTFTKVNSSTAQVTYYDKGSDCK